MSDSEELAKAAEKNKAAAIGKEKALTGVPSDQLEWHGGSVRKTVGSVRVNFPSPFKHIPIVILTPHWIGQGQGVGYVETLSDVSTTGFTLVSGNAANNYYVMWLAVANNT